MEFEEFYLEWKANSKNKKKVLLKDDHGSLIADEYKSVRDIVTNERWLILILHGEISAEVPFDDIKEVK